MTSFHNADVAAIMREIERWYDVTVVIKGDMPKRSFYAGVSRNAKLSELLQILEMNKIHAAHMLQDIKPTVQITLQVFISLHNISHI